MARNPKVRRPKARRPKPKARSHSIVKSEGDRSSGGALSINHASKTIRVDWSRLSPPTDIYDADFAWAEERHGAVSVLFAKAHLSGDGLRSRVEVRFAYEPFVNNLWDQSSEFF